MEGRVWENPLMTFHLEVKPDSRDLIFAAWKCPMIRFASELEAALRDERKLNAALVDFARAQIETELHFEPIIAYLKEAARHVATKRSENTDMVSIFDAVLIHIQAEQDRITQLRDSHNNNLQALYKVFDKEQAWKSMAAKVEEESLGTPASTRARPDGYKGIEEQFDNVLKELRPSAASTHYIAGIRVFHGSTVVYETPTDVDYTLGGFVELRTGKRLRWV